MENKDNNRPTFDEYEKYIRTILIIGALYYILYIYSIHTRVSSLASKDVASIILSFFSYILYFFLICVTSNKKDYMKRSLLFFKIYLLINIIIPSLFVYYYYVDSSVLLDVLYPFFIAVNMLSLYSYFLIFLMPILLIIFMCISKDFDFKTRKNSILILVIIIFFSTFSPDIKNIISGKCHNFITCDANPRAYLSSLYKITKGRPKRAQDDTQDIKSHDTNKERLNTIYQKKKKL